MVLTHFVVNTHFNTVGEYRERIAYDMVGRSKISCVSPRHGAVTAGFTASLCWHAPIHGAKVTFAPRLIIKQGGGLCACILALIGPAGGATLHVIEYM